jgi:hypothetical protein
MTNLNGKMMWVAGLALAASACSEPFDPASLIDSTRILGARVEVSGDPGRSTPAPGESATITWLVEAPGELPPLAWSFAVCPSASTSAVSCEGEPLLVREGVGQPRVDLTVPTLEALAGARRLLITGHIAGTESTLDVPLAFDTEANQNPLLRGRALWFAGEPWGEAASGCESLPQVQAGTKGQVIRLETLESDRERFTGLTGSPPMPVATRESLQISQFATAGEMNSAYAFVEAHDERSPADVQMRWDAPGPEAVPAGGLQVRFTFVARDLRGGMDWTHRSLCVTK